MATISLTKSNFEEIITNNEIIIMDFWADWCGPCKSFAPIFEQVSEQYPTIMFVKVDIENEPELADDFQVRSIPQLVILKQNIVVFSESGTLPVSALQDLIAQTMQLNVNEIHKQIITKEQEQGNSDNSE